MLFFDCLAGRYGVILDAGSSGTRLHIYRWQDPGKARKHATKEALQSLPQLETKDKWTKKTRPGISTFGTSPNDVGPDHLQDLIDHALKYVPKKKQQDTPVFLMATAGMRLLPEMQQKALLKETCTYLRQNTEFALPDCDLHIQVIPGETEGLYGWVASNYLLGGFDNPQNHHHGKGHHTYGFLDMGGASAQIAFAPNSTEAEKHANDLKRLRLRTLDGQASEFKVFTATWLGFGVNQARQSYVKGLLEGASVDASEIPDPCMPKGLRTIPTGEVIEDAAGNKNRTLIGTGMFKECQLKTHPLLGKDAPCNDHPCLLNGQHVPAIDFEVNHFVGVSEYWHTTHGVFGKGDKAYDFATYQKRVQDYCTQDWDAIESQLEPRKKHSAKNAQEACFKAAWLMNVLHEGIGIPRVGLEHTPKVNVSKGALENAKDKGFIDPFKAVDEIDGVEVSWTLGKMLLYAAGQVPPPEAMQAKALPVGFGSNVDGVPPDFNFAGSSWSPIQQEDDDHDDDWSDDIVDKVKSSKSTSGFLIFVLILFILGYFLRKRERRMRLFSKVNSMFRRSRKPGSPRKASRGLAGLRNKLFWRTSSTSYERILEDGDAEQFALGDIDSDVSDGSDSSDGGSSSSRRILATGGGRSSGLATPKLNVEMFDDNNRSVSAIDRSGLVVRTESRERLVPNLQMSNAGRRSRAGSPTRMKSPLVSTFQDD